MDPPDHPMDDAYAPGSDEEEDWELQAALQASLAEASPAGRSGGVDGRRQPINVGGALAGRRSQAHRKPTCRSPLLTVHRPASPACSNSREARRHSRSSQVCQGARSCPAKGPRRRRLQHLPACRGAAFTAIL